MLPSICKHLSSALVASSPGSFWFPPQGSTVAAEVDWLFGVILWISAVFFAIIAGLLVYFVLRYRRRIGEKVEGGASHNTTLELAWTILPTLIVIVIFYYGAVGYMHLRTPPKDAMEIGVTAQKWSWSFTYPTGVVSPELHVPVDRAVRLVMTSEDVLHSFYVPAFRVKMDIVPGRYTKAWFTATEPGQYRLFCAEYCGTQHSGMMAPVIVHEPGGYEKWVTEQGDPLAGRTPVEAGAYLYETRGCKMCHTTDGKAGIGPTFLDSFGGERALASGDKVVVDENYIRESVLNPTAKIAAGFQPVMPTFQGKFKDAELTALIEYIKSLKK